MPTHPLPKVPCTGTSAVTLVGPMHISRAQPRQKWALDSFPGCRGQACQEVDEQAVAMVVAPPGEVAGDKQEAPRVMVT